MSPADVYKTRIGLPISAVGRAQAGPVLARPEVGAISTFIAVKDAENVPASRVRQVTPYLEEVWEPVYGKTRSTDMVEILRASETLVGWKVTKRQTVSSQERARLSAEQFAEQLQSVQIQASDAFYDGHYPTVPGNDPVIVDGEVLTAEDGTVIRGGTMIRGRTEYNQKTKGMAHWDKGFVKERQKALAEEASRPVRNVKANLERVAGEVLPMRRFVANPRYDRKSAV